MSFESATASFSQIVGEVSEVKVVGLQGVRMHDGRVIFMWIDGKRRKMVLSANNGTQIAAGYLDKDISNWRNENHIYMKLSVNILN